MSICQKLMLENYQKGCRYHGAERIHLPSNNRFENIFISLILLVFITPVQFFNYDDQVCFNHNFITLLLFIDINQFYYRYNFSVKKKEVNKIKNSKLMYSNLYFLLVLLGLFLPSRFLFLLFFFYPFSFLLFFFFFFCFLPEIYKKRLPVAFTFHFSFCMQEPNRYL